jgi:hypothetical protein
MKLKDLSDLYAWIRKNNQHTPDEVVDFMYKSAVNQFKKDKIESENAMKVALDSGSILQVNKYIKSKVDVTIYHNNEAGDWQWSIDVNIDPGFWLDAFPTKQEAIKFCKKHGLKITKESNAKTGIYKDFTE